MIRRLYENFLRHQIFVARNFILTRTIFATGSDWSPQSTNDHAYQGASSFSFYPYALTYALQLVQENNECFKESYEEDNNTTEKKSKQLQR